MRACRVVVMGAYLVLGFALAGGAGGAAPLPAGGAAVGAVRLRWLTELGAEAFAVSPKPGGGAPLVVSVPGAALVFAVAADGSLAKRRRLAADPAAPYGVAVSEAGVALADKQGTLTLWTVSVERVLSPRWRKDVGDRVTSVGWDGGERVLAATWKGRVNALAAADGRLLWSTDVAGRAEAPAVVDGADVFVATKAKSLFRLDASTGNVRWKVALPGLALQPPVVLGPRPRAVLCATWDGQLLAYDALTGRVRWSVSLPAKLAGPLLAVSDVVAAVTADSAVHAYDTAGNRLWTAPGSAEGPATLLLQAPAGGTPELLSVSRALVSLELATGKRVADYPHGAAEELRQRFADAMLEGVKTYSEAEKRALLDREAFEISGPVFGPARAFGPRLAFGTEDGWAYVFDAATLRPLARFQAGQPVAGVPRLAGGRILTVAGEEVHALDPQTGAVLWRRVVGSDAGRIAGESTLGVVAGGRVHAVGATDGALLWSARGGFRSVAPPLAAGAGAGGGDGAWIVVDGDGNLAALLPPGRLAGEPLPAGGEILSVLATSDRAWVAATREGKVFGVSREDGRLVKGLEKAFDERILEVHLANGRLLVRSEAGFLAGLDVPSLQDAWKLRLSKEDRIQALPEASDFIVLGADDVRVCDGATGEVRFQRKVPAPAVAAYVRGTALRWLDRFGGVHRVDLLDGGQPETIDLEVSVAGAAPVPGGFLVTTAAGEVGFVEVTESQSRGEGP